jgi:hypothetical protein
MGRIKIVALTFVAVLAMSAVEASAASAKSQVALKEEAGGPTVTDGALEVQELTILTHEGEPLCSGDGKITVSVAQGSEVKLADGGMNQTECEPGWAMTGGVSTVSVNTHGSMALAMAVAEGFPLRIHHTVSKTTCVYELKKLSTSILPFNEDDLGEVFQDATTKLRPTESIGSCAKKTTFLLEYWLDRDTSRGIYAELLS